jgi:hypothetical protein
MLRGRTGRSSWVAVSAVSWRGAPGGEQLGEQRVEPVHRLGAGLDHVIAVFDQGAQRGDRLVNGDGA